MSAFVERQRIYPPKLPGDYNQNGIVDAADYVLWRKGLGTLYTQSHYDVWRAHFGQTAGSGAADFGELSRAVPSAESPSAAVPEPASLVLVFLAAAVLIVVPRGRPVANNRC